MLSFKEKILGSFIILIAVTLFSSIYVSFNIMKVKDDVDSANSKYFAGIAFLLEADRDSYQSNLALMQIISLDDKKKIGQTITKGVEDNILQVRQRFDKFSNLLKDELPEQAAKFVEFDKFYKLTGEHTSQMVSLVKAGRVTEAKNYYYATYLNDYESMRDVMDFFTNEAYKAADENQNGINQMINNSLITFIILVALLSIVILIAYLSVRSFQVIVGKAVESIDVGSEQIVAASNEIASASMALADGSTQQASSVEQVSATIETSTNIINQSSDSAKEADVLAKAANEAAIEGNERVKELIRSMAKTTESSEQIAKIVKTIDEIAFQTNLLALNAAVEAARAGEHGLGFAVVADEVKNLAQRSSDAAKETTNIITAAIEQIKNGNNIANATNESFGVILDRAEQTSSLIEKIAVSYKEQANGMQQIFDAMSSIDKIAQQNAATSEEAAAASEELNAQSVSMKEAVADFSKAIGVKVNLESGKRLLLKH